MVLQDFLTVDISKDSIDSLCKQAMDASYNGILFKVPDACAMDTIDFSSVVSGIPIALDTSGNNMLLKRIIGVDALSYIIISECCEVDFIPVGTKIIFKYSITDLESLHELYLMISLSTRVDLWDININLPGSTGYQDIFDLLHFLKENSVNATIDGIPPCFFETQPQVLSSGWAVNSSLDRSTKNYCHECYQHETLYACPSVEAAKHLSRCKENGSAYELPQVDTVALYSGGLDSRVSVMKHTESIDASVILVNFSDSSTLGLERVQRSFYEEFNRQKKVEGLLCVTLSTQMYSSIINDEKLLQLASQTDTNLTCLMCKALFLYYASIIAKQVGASCIIMGNNQVRGVNKSSVPLPQSSTMMEIFNSIPKYFGIDIKYPIYDIRERKDVVALAKNYGLDLSSSWYSCICSYGNPKQLRKGADFGKAFLKSFIDYLLHSNSLYKSFIDEGLKNAKYIERIRQAE